MKQYLITRDSYYINASVQLTTETYSKNVFMSLHMLIIKRDADDVVVEVNRNCRVVMSILKQQL
jgi:hypothetical protein